MGVVDNVRRITHLVITLKVTTSESLEEIREIALRSRLTSVVLNSLKATVELHVDKVSN